VESPDNSNDSARFLTRAFNLIVDDLFVARDTIARQFGGIRSVYLFRSNNPATTSVQMPGQCSSVMQSPIQNQICNNDKETP